MVIVPTGKHILRLLCLFGALPILSQNLVKNPSFEQFVNCPKRLGNLDTDVASWSTPTEGSTDYFHGCSTAMGTPKNFNGTQPADFGDGYAGLYLYAPDDYREYLQAELTRPLEKGRKYRISFFVSLAERSDFAIKEFGVLFTDHKLEISSKKELSKKQLYSQKGNTYTIMEIGYTNFYSDTQDWIPVNTEFVAKGTEKYLVLGNFKNNTRTRMFKTKRNAKQGAYYYVDMVAVKSAESSESSAEKSRPEITDDKTKTFELDKPHIFEDVLFAFDEYRLLDTAKLELQQIYRYLSSKAELRIVINGHTDSVGTTAYNKVLSSKRAEAVANHLLQMGIAKNRIIWQGHGGESPIASNSTEEGRKSNRRVEFVISNQ